jgi:hypothetical protein
MKDVQSSSLKNVLVPSTVGANVGTSIPNRLERWSFLGAEKAGNEGLAGGGSDEGPAGEGRR